jgi:hypothetical protein
VCGLTAFFHHHLQPFRDPNHPGVVRGGRDRRAGCNLQRRRGKYDNFSYRSKGSELLAYATTPVCAAAATAAEKKEHILIQKIVKLFCSGKYYQKYFFERKID